MADGSGKCLAVGDEFSSFNDVEEAIFDFERQQNVSYWKRDTRTFKAAQKRVEITDNPELKFYEIKHACVKGGHAYSSKGSGQRPNQR